MVRERPVIDDRPLSADRVPTLTEVVELDLPVPPAVAHGSGGSLAAHGQGDEPGVPGAGQADELANELPAGAEGAEAQPTDVPAAVAVPAVEPGGQPAAAAEVEVTPEPEPEAMVIDVAPLVIDAPAIDTPNIDTPNIDTPIAAAIPLPALDIDAVVGQVLAELTPRIDMLLESRLREALAPALARAADGLIRDTRANLSGVVRDLVQEAVDRALQRRAER